MPRPKSLALLAVVVLAASGCRQNDDPEGAAQLYAKITEGSGFRAWKPAPGFAQRTPSFTAHADEVTIFVNDTLAAAMAGPAPIRAWPEGSIVVKQGFRDDDLALVAVMEKRQDGWYWAEYDGEGDALYSGRPNVCVDCHEHRKDYSDWVYAFELPR